MCCGYWISDTFLAPHIVANVVAMSECCVAGSPLACSTNCPPGARALVSVALEAPEEVNGHLHFERAAQTQ